MFLARIDGTITSTRKHENLEGCRLLIGQRLEGDGRPSGEPLIILDWLGARRHNIVIVSTDGDIARQRLGKTTPARLAVVGIVDAPEGVA
jgi:ethanolamine utilization protein EutN